MKDTFKRKTVRCAKFWGQLQASDLEGPFFISSSEPLSWMIPLHWWFLLACEEVNHYKMTTESWQFVMDNSDHSTRSGF